MIDFRHMSSAKIRGMLPELLREAEAADSPDSTANELYHAAKAELARRAKRRDSIRIRKPETDYRKDIEWAISAGLLLLLVIHAYAGW